jgi:plasmid stabilization system protein ParE
VKPVRVLSPATAELEDAADRYDAKSAKTADAFLAEYEAAQSLMAERPSAWHPLKQGLRKIRFNHFPSGIVYKELDTEIVVIAVAHSSRRPTYWRKRLKLL